MMSFDEVVPSLHGEFDNSFSAGASGGGAGDGAEGGAGGVVVTYTRTLLIPQDSSREP